MFVSTDAFVARPGWLAAGWHLWAAVTGDRDYFLGVPLPDLSDMRLVEARYSDGVALTRALLSRALSAQGGPMVLTAEVLTFWTEHSPRACMPSWAACLVQFDKSWLDLLGRWRAGQSADYVRTSRRRIAEMQKAVAGKGRSGQDPAKDFDEEELLIELEAHLARAGVDAAVAAEQTGRFKYVAPETDTEGTGAADDDGFGPAGSGGADTGGVATPAGGDGGEGGEGSDAEAFEDFPADGSGDTGTRGTR